MKQLIFSLLLAGCSLQASAQQELIHPKAQQNQMIVQQPQPYIEIDGRQVAQPSLVLIAAKYIEKAEVLKGEKATSKFGDKAKDGAVILDVKPATELATIHDIYTHFRIPASQQNLRVVINNQLVKDTSLILANLDQIEKVEIEKQEVTAPVRWSLNDEDEFLYITAKPQPKQ
jgi:hypothetical protein